MKLKWKITCEKYLNDFLIYTTNTMLYGKFLFELRLAQIAPAEAAVRLRRLKQNTLRNVWNELI